MDRKATEILEEEHHLIQRVVGCMAAFADRLYQGEQLPREPLIGLVDFMRNFVEKYHHRKEDDLLFPLLVKKGVPVAGCPIGVLNEEHERSRRVTADLGAAVEAFLKDPYEMRVFLINSLRAVVELYPGHIWKENYLLFPMTDKLLNEQEQRELLSKMEEVAGELTAERRQYFERLCEEPTAQGTGR